uniref:p2 protein n=1 Tax=Rice dwarf virus TaxID=10991 RepID=Q5I747_RDV|nr:P2 protein [Rice dwarf virus]
MAYPNDVRNVWDVYNVFRDVPNREHLIRDIRNGLVTVRNLTNMLTNMERDDQLIIAQLSNMMKSLSIGVEKAQNELSKLKTTDADRAAVLAAYQTSVLNIERNTMLLTGYFKQLVLDLTGYVGASVYPILPFMITGDQSMMVDSIKVNMKNVFDDKHEQEIVLPIHPACFVSTITEDTSSVVYADGDELYSVHVRHADMTMYVNVLGETVETRQLSMIGDSIVPDDFAPSLLILRFSQDSVGEVFYLSHDNVKKFLGYSLEYTDKYSIFDVARRVSTTRNKIIDGFCSVDGVPYLDGRFIYQPSGISADSNICAIYNSYVLDVLRYITECEVDTLRSVYDRTSSTAFSKTDVLTSSLLTMQSNISALSAATPQLANDVITFDSTDLLSLGTVLTVSNEFTADDTTLSTSLAGHCQVDYSEGSPQDKSMSIPVSCDSSQLASSTVHSYSADILGHGLKGDRNMNLMINVPGLMNPQKVTVDYVYSDGYKLNFASVVAPDAPFWINATLQLSVSPSAHNMLSKLTPLDNDACPGLKAQANTPVLVSMTINLDDATPALGGEVIQNCVFKIHHGDDVYSFVTDFDVISYTSTSGTNCLKLISSVDITSQLPSDMVIYVMNGSPDAAFISGDSINMSSVDWHQSTSQTVGNYVYTTMKAYWNVTSYNVEARPYATYVPGKINFTAVDHADVFVDDYNTGVNSYVIVNSRIYYKGTPLYIEVPSGSFIKVSYFTSPLKNPTVDTYNAEISRNSAYLIKANASLDSVAAMLNNISNRIDAMERLMEPTRAQQIAGVVSSIGGVISLGMPLLGAIVVTIGTIISIADPDKQGIDYHSVANAFMSWCQYAAVCRYEYGLLKRGDEKLDVLSFMPKRVVSDFKNKPDVISLPELGESVLRGSSTDYLDTGINIIYNDMQLLGQGKLSDWLNKTVSKVENNAANFFERNLVKSLANKEVLPMHARVEITQTEKIGDVYRTTILYTGINEGSYLGGDVFASRLGDKNILRMNGFESGPGRFNAIVESTTEVGNFRVVDWTVSGMSRYEIYAAAGEVYPSKDPSHADVQLLYESIVRDLTTRDGSFVLKHHDVLLLAGRLDAFEELIIKNASNYQYAFIGSNCQNYAHDVVDILTKFKRPQRWIKDDDFKLYIQSIYDAL